MTPAFCANSIPGRAIEFLVGKVAFCFYTAVSSSRWLSLCSVPLSRAYVPTESSQLQEVCFFLWTPGSYSGILVSISLPGSLDLLGRSDIALYPGQVPGPLLPGLLLFCACCRGFSFRN